MYTVNPFGIVIVNTAPASACDEAISQPREGSGEDLKDSGEDLRRIRGGSVTGNLPKSVYTTPDRPPLAAVMLTQTWKHKREVRVDLRLRIVLTV